MLGINDPETQDHISEHSNPGLGRDSIKRSCEHGMHIQGVWEGWNFLSSGATISFSWRMMYGGRLQDAVFVIQNADIQNIKI